MSRDRRYQLFTLNQTTFEDLSKEKENEFNPMQVAMDQSKEIKLSTSQMELSDDSGDEQTAEVQYDPLSDQILLDDPQTPDDKGMHSRNPTSTQQPSTERIVLKMNDLALRSHSAFGKKDKLQIPQLQLSQVSQPQKENGGTFEDGVKGRPKSQNYSCGSNAKSQLLPELDNSQVIKQVLQDAMLLNEVQNLIKNQEVNSDMLRTLQQFVSKCKIKSNLELLELTQGNDSEEKMDTLPSEFKVLQEQDQNAVTVTKENTMVINEQSSFKPNNTIYSNYTKSLIDVKYEEYLNKRRQTAVAQNSQQDPISIVEQPNDRTMDIKELSSPLTKANHMLTPDETKCKDETQINIAMFRDNMSASHSVQCYHQTTTNSLGPLTGSVENSNSKQTVPKSLREYDEALKFFNVKDIERLKAIVNPTMSEINLCMALLSLLVDVTVDSYPQGIVNAQVRRGEKADPFIRLNTDLTLINNELDIRSWSGIQTVLKNPGKIMINIKHLRGYIDNDLLTEKFVKKSKIHLQKVQKFRTIESQKLYEFLHAVHNLIKYYKKRNQHNKQNLILN